MDRIVTYNDIAMPAFMYGTAWKKDQTARLVELAVGSGFTAIDTANQLIHYQEALVGEALLVPGQEGGETGVSVSPDKIYFGLRAGSSNTVRSICRSPHTSSAVV